MPTNAKILHLTLCGPGDVAAEMEIAREVIATWNTHHGEGLGILIKVANWKTDSVPDARKRGQAVINSQIIDSADILVCIFFSRFGSPTGLAESGTQEEIQRGIDADKKVMVYFAGYEAQADAKPDQIERLKVFRTEIESRALTASFSNKAAFEKLFAGHLAKAVYEVLPKIKSRSKKKESGDARSGPVLKQSGKNNVQVGQGNVRIYHGTPPAQKIVEPLPEGAITEAEALTVRDWIGELAEGTFGVSRDEAYGRWTGTLYRKFKVTSYRRLLSTQLPAVEKWVKQQRAIQRRKGKRKAPEDFRGQLIKQAKAAMTSMRVEKEQYYTEVAGRLKMRPFASLTKLTTKDLERVARMAAADSKK